MICTGRKLFIHLPNVLIFYVMETEKYMKKMLGGKFFLPPVD